MPFETQAIVCKWAMVCSITDEKDMDQMPEFGKWFTQKLAEVGRNIGITFDFGEAPSSCSYAIPEDMASCMTAYENIRKVDPATSVVFHILPAQNSMEYHWMKSLSERFGLVRQGILYENAVRRFEGQDLQEICGNVAQWLQRGFSRLSKGQGDQLYVNGRSPQNARLTMNHQMVQSIVNTNIHARRRCAMSDLNASVHLSGLPISISEYKVAGLFNDLNVVGVVLESGTAIVSFENKFQAFQAAARATIVFDRLHTIKISAMGDEVKEQLGKAAVVTA